MIDRYTKFILTVIAGALLYLAVIFTPLPPRTRRHLRNIRRNRAGPPRSWSSAGSWTGHAFPSQRPCVQVTAQSRCRSLAG